MKKLIRFQRCVVAFLLLSFLCGMLLGITLITNVDYQKDWFGRNTKNVGNKDGHLLLEKILPKSDIQAELSSENTNTESVDMDEKLLERRQENIEDSDFPPPNYDVHVFYYPWYGTPDFDKEWLHWDHELLRHWDKKEARKWPSGHHKPPDDIGSNYFPHLGAYSSRNPDVIEEHMKQIRSAGIGVLAVSWYPPNDADGQGKPWDDLMPTILDTAHKYELKVCFHIEPYEGRDHLSVQSDIEYIIHTYSSHAAFYRRTHGGKDLPLYYIYDSYLVDSNLWGEIFQEGGVHSIRGTDQDGLFIGLIVERKHQVEMLTAGFNGFYSYFASDGFSYGSTTSHWASLNAYVSSNDLLFIPSVGPGYVDVRVRPWNRRNTKNRENGAYYEQSFQAAIKSHAPIISITSFNEWHEGTQIERAVPKSTPEFTYLDYQPYSPDYYLLLTKKWVHEFDLSKHR